MKKGKSIQMNKHVTFFQEFDEIVSNCLKQLQCKNRTICYIASPEKKINACATIVKTDDCGSEYGIIIHQGLVDSLVKSSHGEHAENLIKYIVKKYSIDEETHDLKRILFTMAMLTCFFHEAGHIINGHFFPWDKNIKISMIEEIREVTPSGNTSVEEDSLLEYDADSYAGYSLAALPDFLMLNTPDELSSKNAAKEFVVLGALLLYLTLHEEAKKSISTTIDYSKYNYPPLRVRALTVGTAFIAGREQYIRRGSVANLDRIAKKAHIEECSTYLTYLESHFSDKITYTKEEVDIWEKRFTSHYSFVTNVHNAAKNHWIDT